MSVAEVGDPLPESVEGAYAELGAVCDRLARTNELRSRLLARRRVLFQFLLDHKEEQVQIGRHAGISSMAVAEAVGKAKRSRRAKAS